MSMLVRLNKGEWTQETNGFFVFSHDVEGACRGVYLSERSTLVSVKTAVKKEYTLHSVDDVYLSYSWPQMMIGKDISKTPPTVIENDEDMMLFMSIRVELEEMILRVQVLPAAPATVEDNVHGGSQVFGSGRRRMTMDNDYVTQVTKPLPAKDKGKGIAVDDEMNNGCSSLPLNQFLPSGNYIDLSGPGDASNTPMVAGNGLMEHLSVVNPTVTQLTIGLSTGFATTQPNTNMQVPVLCDSTASDRAVTDELYRLWREFGSGEHENTPSKRDGITRTTKQIMGMFSTPDLNNPANDPSMADIVDANVGAMASPVSPLELLLSLGNSSSVGFERSGGNVPLTLTQPEQRSLALRSLTKSIEGFSLDSIDDTSAEGSANMETCSCFDTDSSGYHGYSIVMPIQQPRRPSGYNNNLEGGITAGMERGSSSRNPFTNNNNREGELPQGMERGSSSRNPFSLIDGMRTTLGQHVPTILYDRDAPPFFDDPKPADEVHRAIMDVDYEGDDIFPGRLFKTREDARIKLAIHAIHRKFHFKHVTTKPELMTVACVSKHCPWRVHLTQVEKSKLFEVRTAVLNHTCTVDARGNFHKQASTAVIGQIMRSRYLGLAGGPRRNELRKMLRQEYSLNVSYWKAWRAREIAMDNAMGSAMGSYALVQPYFDLLLKTNPNSLCRLETVTVEGGGERFKYAFMALYASIRGVQYMRKVIIIDGCHLRGKYGGTLLAASAQDGNFQIFPIAFGIVDSENDASWEWFMRQLQLIVPDSHDLVFVSDRQSSIYASIRKVYPMSSHAACILHLQRNIVSIFKSETLSYLVSQAARAYQFSEFNRLFAQVREMEIHCAEYLTSIGLEHWTRSHFVGDRYNVMTSNVAEALNKVLTMAKDFPIISIFESIRTTLVTWFALRRETARMEEDNLTPKVQEKIIENFEKSTGFVVLKIGNGHYEVRDTTDNAFHVNLWERGCDCREFQMLKYPCSHAVAAAIQDGTRVESLAAVEYTVPFWRMAYEALIMPVPDMNSLVPTRTENGGEDLRPPAVRRPSGRPRKLRIESAGVYKRTARKRCSRCHMLGHNKATCKMPLPDP